LLEHFKFVRTHLNCSSLLILTQIRRRQRFRWLGICSSHEKPWSKALSQRTMNPAPPFEPARQDGIRVPVHDHASAMAGG
jgi:hypothetical protein